MRREALRLSPRHRRWFYATSLLLFASGAAWLALSWVRGGADAPPHPWQPWLLKLHGAAAMLILLVLGTLIPLHIRRGWKAGVNRLTGALMVGGAALLVLTGYGLYYAGSDRLREFTANVHDILGLAAPLLLLWHILRGRKMRRRQSAHGRTEG
jgi:hypothetical protein